MIKQRTFGYQSRGKRNRQIHDCSENTKEVPYALRNIAAWYIESNANSYGTDDMVALNEIFQHKDPTTRRGSALQQRLTNCCAQQIAISNGGIICNIPNVITNYLWQSWESAQSVKSVDRFLIASPQYPPRSSVASVCKQSVNVFMSLCRRDKSIFCGYRYDPETRLYYVRNRMYNPGLGSWLQRDPIGYAGGINLYEYVAGRAVVTVDPWGAINCAKQLQVCLHGCNSLKKIADIMVEAIKERCLQHCRGNSWGYVICYELCQARAAWMEGLITTAWAACYTTCNVQADACEAKKCLPKIL